MNGKLKRGIIVVLAGALMWMFPVPSGLSAQAWHLFAIFEATILGFILQPLPIGAVAMISIAFTAMVGVLKPAEVLSGFSNGTVWLIVAAFLYAKGLIKTGLGRRIAYLIMRTIGDSTLKLGYTLAFSDYVMAPFTSSNTARVGGILFPIVKSLSLAFDSAPGPTARRVGAYLMLTTFQSDVVISASFLTASAGNPLIAALVAKTLNVEISWGLWAMAALVPSIISIALIPYIIYKIYPPEVKYTPEAKAYAAVELEKIGPMSRAEKMVSCIFLLALALWTTSTITKFDAAIIAMSGVGLMLMTQVLEWTDVIEEKGAWDTMIWMGSLIGLADYLSKLGFIPWFAKAVATSISGFAWWPALLLLIVIYMYTHYGFASLAAHITAMYPAFAAVAVAAGAPVYLAVMALAYAALLCGGLTHYSTGYAPIYFGSGYVDQVTWWKMGFIMSVFYLVVWIGIGSIWWKVLGLW